MNAIEIRGLEKSYPGFELGPVDLDLPRGSIMGLVGENGAGKTTLIRLIMGAARRDGGSVRVLGEDSAGSGFDKIKQDIGVVLDEACFPQELNVRQLGRVMAGAYPDWDEGRFSGFLRRFSLPEDKQIKKLSRGMRMKLAIAAAVSHSPKLLVLDEPTGGLDPVVRDEILDVFNDFTREEDRSILISSHIVSDLEKICDYVAFLHRGRLLLAEEKDRLLEEYAIGNLTAEELEAVPEEAVVGVRKNGYSARALLRRKLVSPAIPMERAGLEEIILFLVKGEEK